MRIGTARNLNEVGLSIECPVPAAEPRLLVQYSAKLARGLEGGVYTRPHHA